MSDPRPRVGRAWLPYARHTVGRAEERAVLAALRSGFLTQGPRIEKLEHAFARLLGKRHAVAVSSGTAALHAAVESLRLPPGSEVIVPPLTFAATASVLVHCGLVPRFCDVDPHSGALTPEGAAAAITRRTSALLPVDYAGYPCDGAGFHRLANRHGLALLEDATHLLGGRQRGRPAGAWADAAAFSLHPSKAIAAGEGGIVVTDDAALAERARRFREHGFPKAAPGAPASRRDIERPGLNYRLSELHAALALAQIPRLARFIRRRTALARRYFRLLGSREWIDLPALPRLPGDVHAWHLFVVRIRSGAGAHGRDAALRALHRAGIGAQVHYRPVCAFRYYRERWPGALARCPAAAEFARRCLSLPLFPAMQVAQVASVVRALKRVMRGRL